MAWFKSLFLWLVLMAAMASPAEAQFGGPSIRAPRAGDVLQGTITLTGSSDLAGFLSSEVAFAYNGDPTGTWFLISTKSQPVQNGALATWDTTTITDGAYDLRLRVLLSDGTYQDALVPQLRVRNYTPVETPTPTVTPLVLTPVPTCTPTATPLPTPTRLPDNPAALTRSDVLASILYGGLLALLAFLVLGVYSWLRRK